MITITCRFMKNEQEESNQKDYPFNIREEELPELNTIFKTLEYGYKLLKITSIKDKCFTHFNYKTNELLVEEGENTGLIKLIHIDNDIKEEDRQDNNRGTC